MAKKANQKPASGAKPAAENTVGQIVPKTAPAPAGAAPSPPVKPETPKEKGLLEKADEILQKGEIKVLNDAKNGIAGGIDSLVNMAGGGAAAQVVGAIGKGAVEVLFPTNVIDLIPGGKILSGGKKAAKIAEKLGKEAAEKAAKEAAEKAAKEAAEKAAKEAAEKGAKKADVAGNKGGHDKKVQRKPGRRCELVPFDELDCPMDEATGKKQHAHHVVPDFAYRPAGRKNKAPRAEGNPTLESGLAICLTEAEHQAAHRLDSRYAAASNSTRGGAVAGTMTGGQAKAISAANVEKVTGGKKGSGCKKKDLQQQLDKQTPDDKLLRGERHAGRFNNMPDAVKASQPQKGTRE
jgi:hypothetical protein